MAKSYFLCEPLPEFIKDFLSQSILHNIPRVMPLSATLVEHLLSSKESTEGRKHNKGEIYGFIYEAKNSKTSCVFTNWFYENHIANFPRINWDFLNMTCILLSQICWCILLSEMLTPLFLLNLKPPNLQDSTQIFTSLDQVR